MPWIPMQGGGGGASADPVLTVGTARGVTVNADASADTKGAWVQVANPVDYPCMGVDLSVFREVSGAAENVLLDIGTEAAGGDADAILSNLLYYGKTTFSAGGSAAHAFCPIHVPANTTLYARTQASAGTTPINVTCSPRAIGRSGFAGYSRAVTYGVDLVNTDGTNVTPPLSTYSSPVELTASVNFPGSFVLVTMSFAEDSSTTAGTQLLRLVSGTGNHIRWSGIVNVASAVEGINPCWHAGPADIPEVERLAFEAAANQADQPIGVCVTVFGN